MTQRRPSAERQAANGAWNRLFSFVCRSNPFAPLSRTQFCTRRPVSAALVPLVSHSSMWTASLVGTTFAPKAMPLGSRRSMSSEPSTRRFHSSRSSEAPCLVQTVGTCVCAR
jgi:hypothetical protein